MKNAISLIGTTMLLSLTFLLAEYGINNINFYEPILPTFFEKYIIMFLVMFAQLLIVLLLVELIKTFLKKINVQPYVYEGIRIVMSIVLLGCVTYANSHKILGSNEVLFNLSTLLIMIGTFIVCYLIIKPYKIKNM